MRGILKAALFATIFSPALISVGVARLWSGGTFWDSIYYITAGVIGCLLVVYILAAIRWKAETFPFQAKKIESHDALLFGIAVTYFLPFVLGADKITFIIVIVCIAASWVVFWFMDACLPSPLLRVFGYRFYKAESPTGMVYTLISPREILNPANVKHVKKISGALLLEVLK